MAESIQIKRMRKSNNNNMAKQEHIAMIFQRLGITENVIKKNLLLILIIGSFVIGISLGAVLKDFKYSEETLMAIAFPSELFFRFLNLMIVPFLMSCVVYGLGSLNIKKNKRIALAVLLYFFITTILNVLIGVILIKVVQPGVDHQLDNIEIKKEVTNFNLLDSFFDIARNLVPDNIFEATFKQSVTRYVKIEDETNAENFTIFKRVVNDRKGTNSLGLLFFSALFGSVLGSLPGDNRATIKLFQTISQVIQQIIVGAMWLSPLAIISTILNEMLKLKQTGGLAEELAWFVFSVMAGLLLYHFAIVQLIYLVVIRKNPLKYYRAFKYPLMVAFTASTKTSAIGESLNVLDNLGISERVSRFVMSIGSINMDGSALYIAQSLFFIAQINGYELSSGETASLVLTITLMSSALATVPGSALLMTMTLSNLVRATPEDVTLLFAVDWCVDRFRATNNLIGDLYACAVVDYLASPSTRRPSQQFTDSGPQNGIGSVILDESTAETTVYIQIEENITKL